MFETHLVETPPQERPSPSAVVHDLGRSMELKVLIVHIVT